MTEAGAALDDRFAEERARLRDAAGRHRIRHDLPASVEHATVEHAIAQLEAEDERAGRFYAERGGGASALRFLAGRGFAPETLERLNALE